MPISFFGIWLVLNVALPHGVALFFLFGPCEDPKIARFGEPRCELLHTHVREGPPSRPMIPSRKFDGNPISESRQDLARQTHPRTRRRDPSLQWRPSGHSLALGSGPCDCGECAAATRNFIPKRRAVNPSRCPLGSRATCSNCRQLALSKRLMQPPHCQLVGVKLPP